MRRSYPYVEAGVGFIDSPVFDDTATGSTAVTLGTTVTPAGVTFNNSTLAYSVSGAGAIAGTTSIIKNGTAALTLATNNTFNGGVQLNAGTLNVNNAGALGTGTLTIAAGTTLDNTSGSPVVATNAQSWNGDVTFTGTNDLTLGSAAMNASRQVTVNGGTLAVAGITGTGFGLTKAGAGTLAVGASTYTGPTVINAGTLKSTSATAFSNSSSVTLANTAGAALDLNGITQTINTITGGGATGGNIVLNGAVLTTGTASNNTFAGAVTGAGGLTKQGAGVLTLTGDKTGYTGTTNVTAGTLDLGTINGTFGAPVTVTAGAANNSIVVGGGLFVQGNGLLTTGISGGSAGIGARGGNLTVNVGGTGASISINSGGTGGVGGMIFGSPASDSKVIVQNAINLNNSSGTRTITVNQGTGTASAEISGVISNTSSGIVKAGAGTLILSGTNTYGTSGTLTNATVISAGTLQVGNGTDNGSIQSNATYGISNNGALVYNVGSGSRTQANLISGTGSLTQNSSGGTLTLTNANTYSGATSITAGTLSLTGTGAINGTSGITINGSGAKFLQLSSVATTPSITLTQGILDGTGAVGAVTVGAGTGGSVQNGNGTASILTIDSLTFSGAGTLNFVDSAATSAAARIVVNGALATTPASGQVTVNGSGSWSIGANNLLSYGSFGGSLSDFTLGTITGITPRQSTSLSLASNNLVLNVGAADSPKWTGLDSSAWVIGTTGASKNWNLATGGTATDYLNADAVLFDDTAAGTTTVNITTANVNPTSTEFNNSTLNYTVNSTGGFGITSGAIVKNGSAALTINNANTTASGVQLNAGTLNVNNAGALGTGSLTIAAGTTLDNTSGAPVVATNAQNWNGDFTYTGTNDLTLASAAMIADRQVTVNGSTLAVAGITGTGFGLTKAGAGTLAVGASTYTGPTIINAGTLKATSTTSFTTTSSVTLANAAGAALDLNGNSQTISTITGGGASGGNIVLNGAVLTTGTATSNTFAGALTGAGGLTKVGAGTLTLTGDKTGYTGTTNVSAGTLDLGTINGTFGAPVTVTAGGANNSIVVGAGLFVQGNGLLTTGISGGSAGIGARGGDLTVNVGGAGATINVNSGGTGGLGGFIFGSPASDSKVIVQNAINLNNSNGTRTITVNQGTGTASAEISGVISNPISGLVKQGAGTLILSGNNTYGTTITSGISTTISAGTLQIGNGTNSGSIAGSLGIVNNGALVYNVGSGNRTVANLISGSGTVEQKGTGTLTFTAANTYSGGTTVTNGIVLANNTSGSGLGTGSVSVASGATLGGDGGITLTGSNTIMINGALVVGIPSDTSGVDLALSTVAGSGSTILGNGSSVFFDIFAGAGNLGTITSSDADMLRLFGDLTIGTGVSLSIGNPNSILSSSWANGDTFKLFDWAALGTRTGTFSSVDYSALDLPSGWSLNTSDLYTLGNVSIVGVIPEPSRALLMMFGLVCLVSQRRRKQ